MIKISVIIPTYNYSRFLVGAIESVLKQTYTSYEIIVIDDGSTDDTFQAIKEYVENINYVYQVNRGAAAARNAGIRIAKGDYIAFLDADDMWLPKKLEKTIQFMEGSNFDWVCTSRFKINPNGKQIERKIEAQSGIYDYDTKELAHIEIGLFDPNYVPAITSTVLIRKDCFGCAGVFDESLKVGEDLDLWLRFKEAGLCGGYFDEPLTICKSHKDSLSRNSSEENVKNYIGVAKRHARILGIDKYFFNRLYSTFWWETALSYYCASKPSKALKYALLSLLYFPNHTKILKIIKHVLL